MCNKWFFFSNNHNIKWFFLSNNHDIKSFKVVILFWFNSIHGLLKVRLILYVFYKKFTDLAIQLVASRE